jgi:hypothetical protein
VLKMGIATNQNIPANRRSSDRRPMIRTLIALFGAPIAWVIQMSLSEPIAAYACYPHQAPLPAPLWVEVSVILGAIGLVCLAAGLLSGYVAWIFWRQADGKAAAVAETNDSRSAVVDEGQDRFLAMTGLLSSSLFVIAIIFTCCAVFLVAPCSAWT